MIYDIFPRQKPLRDYVLWACAVVSCALIGLLSQYLYLSRPNTALHQRSEQVIDSVIRVHGLVRDSVQHEIATRYDEPLAMAVADSMGTYRARAYLDTASMQELVHEITLKQKNSSVVFGNNSDSKQKTRDEEEIIDKGNYKHTIWLDKQGTVIGSAYVVREALPVHDSVALLAALSTHMPPSLLQQVPVGAWHVDVSNVDEPEYTAVIAEYSGVLRGIERKLVLHGKKLSAKPLQWEISWRNRVMLKHEEEQKPSETMTPIRIAKIIFFSLLAILCLVMVGVFIVRLRKKAVSLSVVVISAVIANSYVTASALNKTMSILEMLLIGVSTTIFYGFFMVGLPTAGLLSLTRETFAEKFYTLKRLLREPHRSFYVGRSVGQGIALGVIYTAFVCVLLFGLHSVHAESLLRHAVFNESYYKLIITEESAFILFVKSVLFLPLFIVVLYLAAPTLVYRFVQRMMERRWALLLTLAVGIDFSVLFEAVKTDSLMYAAVYGTVEAVAGLAVFVYADILALIMFAVTIKILLASLVFSAYPILIGILGVMYVGLIGFAIVAYRSEPETVSEEEYKPQFVVEKEEQHRLHQELAAAKAVQQRLLPACLPAVESVEVCAMCIPAYEVGGDYYDFFHLDENRLGVLIGDVSGKGISAAFYITLAKGVIVSQVRQQGTPSEVLHRVNSLLYGVMERGKFVSMIYGIFNTKTREFAFANAGHSPVLFRKASGETRMISSRGMAIGLDKGTRFEAAVQTASVSLASGDTVVLYTDGVTEAMNGGMEEYGDERMLDIARRPVMTADALVTSLLADVRTFAGKAPQHDDITIVALKAL